MQISCSACGKHLQIPDDKLPTDRHVRITCPACHEQFTVEPHNQAPPADSPTDDASAPSPLDPTPSIDVTEAGPAPRALICLDTASHRDECESMLPSLGFNTVHVMPNQAHAMGYISQVSYEMVILDATFDGGSRQANPVLACLHEIPMDQRRRMFIVLCTPDAEAIDAMAAYSQSMNLIVSHADVLTCRRTLEQHMAEHTRLYRVYRDVQQALGKD